MTDRRLLLVHAHPDDETIGTGATMARYAAQGAQVTLVTCTLGEVGEVLVPELAELRLDAGDQLGGYRIGELERACAALGVSDHRFLGGPGRYRDSGMMDTKENDHPRAFWGVDLDVSVRDMVAVIREVRPQVLVTYDENGGYGHPDHIQAHNVAMKGAVQAADGGYAPELGQPWAIEKVYWTAIPRSLIAEGMRMAREQGVELFPAPEGEPPMEEPPFGTPDELITTAVDASAFVEAKRAAMRAHASQIPTDGPLTLFAESPSFAVEHYMRVQGPAGPGVGPQGWEDDLFAGLDVRSER